MARIGTIVYKVKVSRQHKNIFTRLLMFLCKFSKWSWDIEGELINDVR